MTIIFAPTAFAPFLMMESGTKRTDCIWNGRKFAAYGRYVMDSVVPPTGPIANDEQLLTGIAQGDRTAFAALYERFSRPLYSLAYKMLASESEAQDVVQEVFLSVWNKAPTFDSKRGSAFSWVVTQVRNRAIDRIRSHRRRGELIDAFGPDLESGEIRSASDNCEAGERAREIRAAMGQLSDDQHQVLRLAYFEGLTQVEIAQKLDEPLGTIKARAHRAMARLRTTLRSLHD